MYKRPTLERPTAGSEYSSWPTPAASIAQDGEDPSTWLARRERLKVTANNGNGAGMPLTIASALWSTPRSSDGEKGGPNMAWGTEGTAPLPAQAVLWATPGANEHKYRLQGNSQQSKGLAGQAQKNWHTPRVADASGVAYQRSSGQIGSEYLVLAGQARTWAGEKIVFSPGRQAQQTPKRGPRTFDAIQVLNPRFVEALMGWPSGWSDCELSATASSPSKPSLRGAFSILDFF